ncbi:hypothetical protein BDY24DRAFT_444656 [Mrakia frigida]|uniref:uncharacterized protein n=1 Tax=Mrakia frigida TaxID=29902 RepID=UPI003FCC1069
MSSLRQLPIRLQDLILQLRYPLPGLSEVESYQLRELRRGGWLRDGPDELTSKEKNVLIEMQAGFEHAQVGEEEYWEAVWDRRRRIVMDREAAVVPPQHRVKMEQGEVDGGGAINSSRSASGSGRFDLETARSTSTLSDGSRVEASQAQRSFSPPSQDSFAVPAAPRRASLMSLSSIVEPTTPSSIISRASSSSSSSTGHGEKNLRRGSQNEQTMPGGSSSNVQGAPISELVAGLKWEDVRTMNLDKRAALGRKLLVASPTWRSSLPFFPPVVVQTLLPINDTFASALSIFDTSSNSIIPKPPPYALDKPKHQKALNDLHHLVRFRSPKGRYEPGEKDDFESDLFKCWQKEEDGRVVERLLLCAILNEEIRNKRTNWFGHVAVENSKGEAKPNLADDATTNSSLEETKTTTSKGKKRVRSRSPSLELEDASSKKAQPVEH